MILKRKLYTDTEGESTKKGSGIGGGAIAALGIGAGTAYGIKKHADLVKKEGKELYDKIDKIREDAKEKTNKIIKKAEKPIVGNYQEAYKAIKKMPSTYDAHFVADREAQRRLLDQYSAYNERAAKWRQARDSAIKKIESEAGAEIDRLGKAFRKNGNKRLMKSMKSGALVATPIVALGIGKHYYDKNKNRKNDSSKK